MYKTTQEVAVRSANFKCHPDLGVAGHDPEDRIR
jgi:hypothetical protein